MNHDDLPPGVTAPGYPVMNYHGADQAVRDAVIGAGMVAAVEWVGTYHATGGDTQAAGKAAVRGFGAALACLPLGFLGFFATVLGLLNLFGGAPTSGFFELLLSVALWWALVAIWRAKNRSVARIRRESWLRSLPPPQPLVRTYIDATATDVTNNWS